MNFKTLLGEVNSIYRVGLIGTGVAPLADYLVRLGPVWPEWSPILSSLSNFAVMALITASWAIISVNRLRQKMIACIFVSGISLLIYVSLYSLITVQVSNGPRVVRGYELKPDADDAIKKLRQTIDPGYTADDALRDSEYRPENVWTIESLTLDRMAMLVTWLLFFSGFSAFTGAFALQQLRQVAGKRQAATNTEPPSQS